MDIKQRELKENGKEVPNCVKEGKTFSDWKKAAAKVLKRKIKKGNRRKQWMQVLD